MNKFMLEAIKSANEGIKSKDGGPFGCCIVDSNDNIIAVAHNNVLGNNDPTAHAEIEAIRIAGEKINSYDLKDCKLYTTCEPCPMCLFAIMWANIKGVYYGCNRVDAADIGFRDEKFYEMIKDIDNINLYNIDREECLKLFKDYNNKIY